MFSLTEIGCLQSLDVFNNENLQGVYLRFHISRSSKEHSSVIEETLLPPEISCWADARISS